MIIIWHMIEIDLIKILSKHAALSFYLFRSCFKEIQRISETGTSAPAKTETERSALMMAAIKSADTDAPRSHHIADFPALCEILAGKVDSAGTGRNSSLSTVW